MKNKFIHVEMNFRAKDGIICSTSWMDSASSSNASWTRRATQLWTSYQRAVGVLALLLIIGNLPAAENNPRVQRLLEACEASTTAAQEAYDRALRKAEDERAAALLAARERTVDELKRLIFARNSNTEQAGRTTQGTTAGSPTDRNQDIITHVEIYAHVRRLKPDDPDAEHFFKGIDPLRQELKGMKLIAELPANTVDPSEPATDGTILSVWNQYNSGYRDRGSDKVQVQLFRGANLLHEIGPLAMPWEEKVDKRLAIPLPPKLVFDRVRVKVLSWHGMGGGLSEIQLMGNGKNLLAKWAPSASDWYDERFDADRVIDGITSSADFGKGYWLLPDNAPGWIELSSELVISPDF